MHVRAVLASSASSTPALPEGSHRKSGQASHLSQRAGNPAARRGRAWASQKSAAVVRGQADTQPGERRTALTFQTLGPVLGALRPHRLRPPLTCCGGEGARTLRCGERRAPCPPGAQRPLTHSGGDCDAHKPWPSAQSTAPGSQAPSACRPTTPGRRGHALRGRPRPPPLRPAHAL